MRVLLVNAFHYPRGGVERAYLDESRWLAAAGHDVAHFAIRDPRNLPSPTGRFFAPAADYGEGAPLGRLIAQLPRAIWSAPAARALDALLDAWKPEVAHVHAPSRYLTPSVLRALERRGVPMVMTLHDFKPWCTNRVMFAKGAPCLRCRGGAHWHAAAVACVQGSRAKSVVGAIEAYVHDARGAYRGVRRWIAPSRFVRDRAVALGLDPARIAVIPHGIEPAAAAAGPGEVSPPAGPYLLYAGRLSPEKGVALLPAIAARVAPAPVLVAGEGPYRAMLEHEAARTPNLRLLGHLARADLSALLAHAHAAIVPSLSEETFCFAAAEALLAGRPVVAARIGAIPELVEHEVTGLLAAPGEPEALALAARRALEDAAACDRWGAAGRERVRERTAPGAFVRALLETFASASAIANA